ncbi:MAG: hypothetical protein HDR11_12040 [Lachnospiraceae bacterium]|nr:hypothetical protein [Lachnospiraceae bacterium]
MKKITLALAAVLFLLAACGSSSTENEAGEWQTKQQSEESLDVYAVIQDFDFSVQEYPIDTALYTAEVDKEFKNAFWEAISNQVPMEYEAEGAVYFRDWFRGVAYESDVELIESLQKAKYRFIDMDGDGLPELAMQWAWDLCILRYDIDEKRVKGYFGPAEGWVLLGSDRLGIHNTGSPHLERNEYRFLGGRDGIRQVFDFERDTMYETLCTVTASGEINVGAAVSEEEWEELAADFFYAMEHPVAFVSFEEAFGGVPDRKMVSAEDVEEAYRAYEEFLAGERSVGSEDIYDLITPTGEPDKRYNASYCIWDVDGDGVPELHILSGREYTIYSYEDGEMVWFQAFFSRPWEYVLLESGAFLNLDYQGYEDGEICYYYYFELDENGNEVNALRFEWKDTNRNNVCDEEDAFRFADSPCTPEEWLAKTDKYLYVTEEGGVEVKNPVAWTAYVEQEWR